MAATSYSEKLTQSLEPGEFLFTSESVNEGHPDKLCDIVSDAVLDACMEVCQGNQLPLVACETAAKDNMVMVFGEITLPKEKEVDYESVVRAAVKKIGYADAEYSIDYNSCEVINKIAEQSPDIAQGVHGEKAQAGDHEVLKAGDQGIMFGYATDETQDKMPLSHVLATRLGAKLTEVRKSKQLEWVRPDGKTQVTVVYKNVKGRMVPVRVHTIVISTMHTETYVNEAGEAVPLTQEIIAEQLKEHVINPVLKKAELQINNIRKETGDPKISLLNDDIVYFLNPSGRFVRGGPLGDAGLTGRKIIIDTYGGWGAHGGGAFSGKDPSKVDRSAAYAARWIAKSLLSADNPTKKKLASRVLVQLSYAIGVEHPLSVHVDTYGTAQEGFTDEDLAKIVSRSFDLTPQGIITKLKLNRPIYSYTSVYGHFGRTEPAYEDDENKPTTPIADWATWEQPIPFDDWVGIDALKANGA